MVAKKQNKEDKKTASFGKQKRKNTGRFETSSYELFRFMQMAYLVL